MLRFEKHITMFDDLKDMNCGNDESLERTYWMARSSK